MYVKSVLLELKGTESWPSTGLMRTKLTAVTLFASSVSRGCVDVLRNQFDARSSALADRVFSTANEKQQTQRRSFQIYRNVPN